MENLLPIGSVVKMHNKNFMVTGYSAEMVNGTNSAGYVMVPMPLGFVNSDSIFFASKTAEYEVVSLGYMDDDYEKSSEVISSLIDFTAGLSEEDLEGMRQFNNDMKEYEVE